jgi:acetolactate synthase-1/2/3 large subunit
MPTMTGARYLAESLEAYGVGAVFLVPTMLSRTLVEMEERTSIQRIVTHGEKAAAYMADGYARASGGLGVCMAQTIGAANLASGLRDAYLTGSPVLALSGGPYPWSRHRMQYQEIDDLPLFKPLTKLSMHVPVPARLPGLLTHAVNTASAGKPGPVHLELPGHTGELIEDGELDAEIPSDVVSLPRFRPRPDPEAVRGAVERLAAASRPVIVAGGGVVWSGAQAELLALAERLDVPVATSMNGKSALPTDHRLNIGVPGLYPRANANQVILEADLVFFVGSQTGSQVTLNWQVPRLDVEVVHLDIDPGELGRHYPDSHQVLGDAQVTLATLAEAVSAGPQVDRTDWLRRVARLTEHWRAAATPLLESDDAPMRPERLMGELNGVLPDDAIVVVDTGHAGMWASGYLELNQPGQGFLRAGGSLGWALPASLGAKLAAPERPVVLFTGDGGFWYHIAELETAARWGIGTVMVVNDNRSLNQEIHPYTAAYGGSLRGRHDELWHFRDVDLAAVARSMGVHALRVDKPSAVGPAIEEALDHGGPVVVDVVTDIDALAPKGSAVPAAI